MKYSAMTTFKELVGPMVRRPEYVQAAALCLRDASQGKEVLLVTSLTTKRWIVPKGWPMKDRSLALAALQEAWEEAGVQGQVSENPLGSYVYQKVVMQGVPVSCRCNVFRVDVTGMSANFPEKARRKRLWLRPADAAELVEEPGLKMILSTL